MVSVLVIVEPPVSGLITKGAVELRDPGRHAHPVFGCDVKKLGGQDRASRTDFAQARVEIRHLLFLVERNLTETVGLVPGCELFHPRKHLAKSLEGFDIGSSAREDPALAVSNLFRLPVRTHLLVNDPPRMVDSDQDIQVLSVGGTHPADKGCPLVGVNERVIRHVVADMSYLQREKTWVS